MLYTTKLLGYVSFTPREKQSRNTVASHISWLAGLKVKAVKHHDFIYLFILSLIFLLTVFNNLIKEIL